MKVFTGSSNDNDRSRLVEWLLKIAMTVLLLLLIVLFTAGFSSLFYRMSTHHCAVCGSSTAHMNRISFEDGRELDVCSNCIRQLIDKGDENAEENKSR